MQGQVSSYQPDEARDGSFLELRADLERLAGVAAADAFFAAFAGRRIYVPANVTSGSPIALAMGLEPAKAFAAEYGRETIEVPMAGYSVFNAGTAKLESVLLGGATVAVACRECGCSERAARRVRKRLKEQGRLP